METLDVVNGILEELTGHDDICTGDEEQQSFDFGYINSLLSDVVVSCDCSSPAAFGKTLMDQIWELDASDYADPMGYISVENDFDDMFDVLAMLASALVNDAVPHQLPEQDFKIDVTVRLQTPVKAKSRLEAEQIFLSRLREGWPLTPCDTIVAVNAR